MNNIYIKLSQFIGRPYKIIKKDLCWVGYWDITTLKAVNKLKKINTYENTKYLLKKFGAGYWVLIGNSERIDIFNRGGEFSLIISEEFALNEIKGFMIEKQKGVYTY